MTDNVRPEGPPDGDPKVPAPPRAPTEPAKEPENQKEKEKEPATIKAAAAPSEVGTRSDSGSSSASETGSKPREEATIKAGPAMSEVGTRSHSGSSSASETGPKPQEEALGDEDEEEPMADEEEEEMVAAQPKLKRNTRDIDWTEAGFERERKRRPLGWVVVLGLGALGLGLIFLMFPRRQTPADSSVATPAARQPVAAEQPGAAAPTVASQEPPKRTQRGKSDFPSPPASLPPARVQTPKSLSDLRIGTFSVNPRRPGDQLTVISGDIENVSGNLHRGIRIELDLLDAKGLKIGTVNEFVTELAAGATWHVLVRTTNARATSARLTGIKEEP